MKHCTSVFGLLFKQKLNGKLINLGAKRKKRQRRGTECDTDSELAAIALLEEQQLEAAEQVEDESNSIDNEPTETEATPKNEVLDEKPDINDVPMEENEVKCL
ncbi:PREDICTED: uncharacterized protein LOC103324462 [Prunus mume]|uniref:Uncharacterized protein LOC103324462 n=1 Tax=Prunus mume TaxID=102107 RepID=A0ABM0NH69_PRUMU|nr:PREDICTED: uncharacterized protein LOC103324462 [Prunus mume]